MTLEVFVGESVISVEVADMCQAVQRAMEILSDNDVDVMSDGSAQVSIDGEPMCLDWAR